MKNKILTILLIIFGIFSLTGCGADEKTAYNTNGKKQSEFNMNETAVYNDVHYTISDTKYYTGGNPKSGYVYLKVSIKVENKSDSVVNYPIIDLRIKTKDGNLIPLAGKFTDDLDNYSLKAISPNGVVTGTISFEVPLNDEELKLVYLDYDTEVFEINLK